MLIQDHCLLEAEQSASPNYNERPANTTIDLVVVHNIALPPKQYGGSYIRQFFLNQLDEHHHPYFQTLRDLKVSAHLVLYRDGRVEQFVPFDKRAWHAGQSSYQGRDDCNNYSIGIELEGSDDLAYTDLQYEKLNEILFILKKTYPSLLSIAGHRDVSPGRKTDPGDAFDWDRVKF